MIYVKYTDINDPTVWSIWAHKKDEKIETLILNSNGDTYPHKTALDYTQDRKEFIIKYLAEKEVDLLKLEL